MKNNLYISVGNTNTSFAYSPTNNIDDLKIIKKKTRDIFDISLEKTKNFIDEIIDSFETNIKFVVISSVVISVNNYIEKCLLERNIKYEFISWKNTSFLDLSNLYNPYELGSDILAQSCYINSFFKEAIVLSAGTASVIYHIKNGKFSGAIIMPGISQSISTLTNKTEIGNFEIIETKKTLGFNTNEAISIGVIGVIETIIEYKMKELNTECPIICTGWDAKFFQKNKWWFIENLEIMGMFIYAQNKGEKVTN